MSTRLIDRVLGLRHPRILVVGDLILDGYVWGKVSRISPEAPIPVLNVTAEENRLGGAANVGANLRALEARVDLAGVLGDDEAGRTFLDLARKNGLNVRAVVRDPARSTSVKARMVAQNQQILRVDRENPVPISKGTERDLARRIRSAVNRADLVVVSDYNKGTVTPGVVQPLLRSGVPVLVGLKGRDPGMYRGATGATLNRAELRAVSGVDDLTQGARWVLNRLGLQFLGVTLGEEGLAIFRKGERVLRLPTVARQVFDVTGAGDTTLAAFGLAFSSGLDLEDCARIANAAAGVVVGKVGTATVTREEIASHLRRGGTVPGTKILSGRTLRETLARERRRGRRIVFTNGCFDLLHAGHVELLRFAKAQGDVLVVGLNSDRSVRKLKGNGRPVIRQDQRALILSSLEACDYVALFDEPTPETLIRKIRPDVIVKGEDWMSRGVAGSALVERRGGSVRLAPLVRGISTSGIIERILERFGDGVSKKT